MKTTLSLMLAVALGVSVAAAGTEGTRAGTRGLRGARAGAREGGAARGPQAAGERPFAPVIMDWLQRLGVLRADLNLTPEQKTQLRAMVQNHRADIVKVLKPLVAAHRALRQAVMAQTPDEAAIRTAAENVGKALADAAVLAAKIKGEIRAVLTPDQIQTIEAFHTQNDQEVQTFLDKLGETK